MKAFNILAVFLSSIYFFAAPVIAQEKEVQPTEKEIQYMEKLDKDLESKTGSHMDNVDSKVTEKSDGQRVIHMDYSDNEGAVIEGSSNK